MPHDRIEVSSATASDRVVLYGIRHDVYAQELGQHQVNSAGSLRDALDEHNHYIVAKCGGVVVGFISVTPPSSPSYSIEKYVPREKLPFIFDDGLYEIRLLTVTKNKRSTDIAVLLMYSALRWVESHGGTAVMAIGRYEILEMYRRVGLQSMGIEVTSGAVKFEVMHASTAAIQASGVRIARMIARFKEKVIWHLPFPFYRSAECFHGGAFFGAIGTSFDALHRSKEIINADVLDAWFPPSPRVIAKLQEHLPWLLRTSPPTSCDGLVRAIADARGVAPRHILPGAGSSDLIFRAFREWLSPASRVLILDPTYGEYAHFLEKVIGCTVDRLMLDEARGFEVDTCELERALGRGYDLVVLVNPNSPTGRILSRDRLEGLLSGVSARTRVWVDETYMEYVGPEQSLEKFAARSEHIVICKSMSKCYALSGARVGYLCAGAHQLEALRAVTPPWVVSLPAQVAAVEALRDPKYYAARYAQTRQLRSFLDAELRSIGIETFPGVANFLLCRLPADGPDAATLVARCRERDVFIRDAAQMGSRLGARFVRIAVKDADTNVQILHAVSYGLGV